MAVKVSLLCQTVSRSCHSLLKLVRLGSMNGGLKNIPLAVHVIPCEGLCDWNL